MKYTGYLDAVVKMRQAAKAYYLYPDFGETTMTDSKYDSIYRDMNRFELEFPEFVHPLSVVDKVKGGIHSN